MKNSNNGSEKNKIPVVPREFLVSFCLLVTCFVLWGVLNNMTDNLVPAFGKIFMMNSVNSSYIQMAFYGSYAVLAIPAALLIQKYSYKAGILTGLGLYTIGALGYIPAAILQNYQMFLVAIFVLAGGLAILETTCNPAVISLGSEETSVRRLNLAQAFNPFGSLCGIILAKFVILSHLNPATYEERVAMEPAALSSIRANELLWVCVPYVGLIAIAMVIWVYFFKRGQLGMKEKSEKLHIATSFKNLLKRPRFVLGVITMFFENGMRLCVWTWTIQYAMKTLHVDEAAAANVYLVGIIIFIVSRWICTLLMNKFKPAKIMAVLAVAGIFLTLGAIYLPAQGAVVCLVSISGCTSLMFPTIYGIGLEGLGDDVKLGSAGMVMGILGGAVVPPLMGKAIDSGMFSALVQNCEPSQIAIRSAFFIPVACFLVILGYALKYRNK